MLVKVAPGGKPVAAVFTHVSTDHWLPNQYSKWQVSIGKLLPEPVMTPVYWHIYIIIYIYDMPPNIPIPWTIFIAEKNVSISFLKWFKFFSFLSESSLTNWLVITGIGKNRIDINISLFIFIKALSIFILFLNNNIFRSISMKYLFP